MTDYYFTKNPNTEHDEHTFDFELLNNDIYFTADNGVFSKNTIDFGTRTLLDALNISERDNKLLDLGCGYGPMGIAIAKKYPKLKIEMTDVNERALGLAKRNAEQNGVNKQVEIYESSVYENIKTQDFTTIISNPPVRAGKKIVDKMIVEAKEHLVKQGQLVIVLQKKQGAPSAKKLMKETFGNVEVLKKNKGYYILRSENE